MELNSEPSMKRHRPSSETSQDISHVLAKCFMDIYTKEIICKDTTSNIIKKGQQHGNHERYIVDLKQAHDEYAQRMKEADMLENHIFEASLSAIAKEDHEIQVQESVLHQMEGVYDKLVLPFVRSKFEYCVDNEFLKNHNLICPKDYIPKHGFQRETPKAKPYCDKSRPTSRDNSFTLTSNLEKSNRISEEDLETILEVSSLADTKNMTPCQKPTHTSKPRLKDQMRLESRAKFTYDLQKLNHRRNFLLNPRFLPPIKLQGGKSLVRTRTKAKKTLDGNESGGSQSPTDEPILVFVAHPAVVFFTDYTAGQVYETTLELKNLTTVSRSVRVIPPTTAYFSISLGRFPGEGGIVAPGMSCQYTVRFAPDSLADYQDFIVVETQALESLLVPIDARRPPPILTLPGNLDCGHCLVGLTKVVELQCWNAGLSAGTFCIVPKSQWPAANLRSAKMPSCIEQPPFAVGPSLFHLQPGQATLLEVFFFPSSLDKYSQSFTIVCDNCQVKDITIQGEGEKLAVELVSVSMEEGCCDAGETPNLPAKHLVRFASTNPHSMQHRKVVIRNNTHVVLPFYWQLGKPSPQVPNDMLDVPRTSIQFDPGTDDVFSISPMTGLLDAGQDSQFVFTYIPKKLKDYHSVCQLVIRDIPQLPADSNESRISTLAKVTDVTAMEIEIKGSTEPYQVLLEPHAISVPGDVLIGSTTSRKLKLMNHSKFPVHFDWDRISNCHEIQVEPSTGEIEANQCCDLELLVTGGRAERLLTRLLCHIAYHHTPVILAVDVVFKGPMVTTSEPSLDLGLLRQGEQAQASFVLTNSTQIDACWTLEEKSRHGGCGSQLSLQPRTGVLASLASCSVDVIFKALFCQHFETLLELSVENGTGCHVSVQADVQSSQVCLRGYEHIFSDVYLAVPTTGTVTLVNQSLLSTDFSWMSQLRGKLAFLCEASFQPSSGTLGPNASMEVTVTFTSYTDLELSGVAALCEVQGMAAPIVLDLYAKAKQLSVSYSLLTHSFPSDKQEPSSLLLDFGDVILQKIVSKQLEITNHTAIPAPFTIKTEYFTACLQNRSTCIRKPIHSVQARKLKKKEHTEFISSLLAHGKGAAFNVDPDTGTLGPFETQTIDITAYSDMWGEYRDDLICQVGELEPRLIPLTMTVSGCPLYSQMLGPCPDNQNQGPIIRFGAHMSGGDTVCRALRINNSSPHDIRIDWETFNYEQSDKKLVDLVVSYGDTFTLKDTDGNEVVDRESQLSFESASSTWDTMSRPASLDTTSSYFCKESNMEEKRLLYPQPSKRKLISAHIRPHTGNLSDYPFSITPQQIVIPAKGSTSLHVSFTPLTLSGYPCEAACVGFALGFMSLNSKLAACIPGKVVRAQGLSLEPLRIDMEADVMATWLLVDLDEDEGQHAFHCSADDLLKVDSEYKVSAQDFDVIQSLQLKNTLKVPLHFRLKTQPPFYVPSAAQPRAQSSQSGSPPTGEGHPVALQPQHSCQVKVSFHCDLSLLDRVNQAEQEVPPTGTLVHTASGQRSLQLIQNLLIHYSNNSIQTVPLYAQVDLPTLCLSTDNMDFGSCDVGQTQDMDVTLYNQGACSVWTAILQSDEGDPDAFRVTPHCGVLRPNETPHTRCRQRVIISFTASYARHFRGTVIFQDYLVRPHLLLHVKGTGMFNTNSS